MPGRNFINSPILPSAIVPNSSAETTLTMFRAKRCSLIAMAAPSISLEEATTNWSKRTTSLPGRRAPAAGKVRSRVVVCPAVTVAVTVCRGRPVKKAFTRTVPAGIFARRYWPVSPERTSTRLPSTEISAFSRYSPRPASNTRPSIAPVPAPWAGRKAGSRVQSSRARARRADARGGKGDTGNESMMQGGGETLRGCGARGNPRDAGVGNASGLDVFK